MQTEIIFIIGVLIGFIVAWIIVTLRFKSATVSKINYNALNEQLNNLNIGISVEKEKVRSLAEKLTSTELELKQKLIETNFISNQLSAKAMELTSLEMQFIDAKDELQNNKTIITQLQKELQIAERDLSINKTNLITANNSIILNIEDIKELKNNIQLKTNELNEANKQIASFSAINLSLQEKLETQKTEIEILRKQFNTDFENIANKILEEKTKKFTDLNKDNLETLLKPLGENLKTFKEKVEEVYDKESKERFSLGKEVEKLVMANQKISEEANNLTNALTSKGKVQGDWGQMILESILEKSGLTKDREYFVQTYLKDELLNYHENEHGTRMQPDVIVNYPDNRKVIVDAKVSLTAYNRYSSTNIKEEETKALNEHIRSIKKHIDDLSAKSYQDFAPSLDFVMLFVPIEPAYLIAIHSDQDLWSYAYNKRILLTSPSNLIVALKMIVDLWKRDNQSKNHQEIVERGGKLYDKFTSVLFNLKEIGGNLKATQKSYNNAVNQLSEGNDNVLKQVEKLKTLGAKAKRTLPEIDSLPLLPDSD